MGAGFSLNGRRSSSRFPVSADVGIAAVHTHINGAFSAYPSLHNLPGLKTRLDVDDVLYHAEDESPHEADEHSQLPRSYPQADDINRLHRVRSYRSTPAFLPKVIEATTTLLPFSSLFSGARTLPPLGEDVVAVRQIRPSYPASACLFSTLILNLVLTHGIPSNFRGGVHLFIPLYAIEPVYRVTQLRIDGVHCRESTGTGSVVLKVVPAMGAAFAWTN